MTNVNEAFTFVRRQVLRLGGMIEEPADFACFHFAINAPCKTITINGSSVDL